MNVDIKGATALRQIICSTFCCFSAMFCRFMVVIALWYCTSRSSNATCSDTTYCAACVASGSDEAENECQQQRTIFKLSNFTKNRTNCTTVQINLTSGKHTLDEDLEFEDSVEYTEMQGSSNGPPTIVQCENNSGIKFGNKINDSEVCLSNIAFMFCQHKVTPDPAKYPCAIQTALYFENTAYSLQNITVSNTGGYGVFVLGSKEQFISNCTFASNSDVHVHIVLGKKADNVSITIAGTKFCQGKSNDSSGRLYLVNSANYQLRIVNCEFNGSEGLSGSHVLLRSRPKQVKNTRMDITIEKSTFRAGSISPGVTIETAGNEREVLQISLKSNTFSKNEYGSLHITNAKYVVIEKCTFEGDRGIGGDCSVLQATNVVNVTLRDINISNNLCTGIRLIGSRVYFERVVKITGNTGWQGGAISLRRKVKFGYGGRPFSELIFRNASEVSIIDNTATTYGGGIHSDETCEERNTEKKCFFQFEEKHTSAKSLVFSGNTANHGGELIFGGCLSNCKIEINETNKSDAARYFGT